MTQFSIAMPSNRNLANSARSIETALILAEKTGSRLVVSDNSGDEEKRRRWENASPNLHYIHSPGATVTENGDAALAAVDTPFILPMGDDDEVYLRDDVSFVDLAALPEDVCGIRPYTIHWSDEDGPRNSDHFALEQSRFDGRLRAFTEKSWRNNHMFYSIWRTPLYRRTIGHLAGHPTGGGFTDWAIVTALIACGKVIHSPALVFCYNVGNWTDETSAGYSYLKLLHKAGLPDEAQLYWALLRLVDTHALLMDKGLAMTREMRINAINTNAYVGLASFAADVDKDPHYFTELDHAFAAQARHGLNPARAYELTLPLLEQLKPGLADAYAAYLKAVAR